MEALTLTDGAMEALTLTDGFMEEADHSQIRREGTSLRAPGTPCDEISSLAYVNQIPGPREGDTYDELLDYDSDTYEYRRKRGKSGYKPVQFVYSGMSFSLTKEEAERKAEIVRAEFLRLASSKMPEPYHDRPRFAGLGSVKEYQPYRPATSADESSAV